MKMKYIIIDSYYYPMAPILFHPCISHKEMANNFRAEILSAGFVRIINNEIEVFGQSTSLGKAPNYEFDVMLIAMTLLEIDEF